MIAINHPLDFIAGLDGKPMHIALFYEDEEYARQIEYSFLRNGLARSQTCIYTIHGGNLDVKRIRTDMTKHGIDVDKFESSGLLHILKICDPRDDPSGFERGIENLLKGRILKEEKKKQKKKIRLVCNLMRTIENEDDAKANMLLERRIHSRILEFPGLIMCPYHIDKVPHQIHVEWFLNLMQHHHAAVFAPKFFEGAGLIMDK